MTGRWLAVVACLVGLAGCDRPEPPVDDQAVRPAKLYRVTAEDATTRHQFVGRVEAAQTVDVSFEVAGELVRLPIREGQSLAAGARVASLDPRDFELALREAEVQLRLATRDLERKEALLRQKSIPVSLVDDARAEYDLWLVRLAQAQEHLADTSISAPFDGYVARRYVDNRSRVQAGQPIARLLDLTELKVVASVPAELLATVTPERVVSIMAQFDFLPDAAFPMLYRESRGEASDVAQTYDVTFTLQPPQGANILPGMTARVQVDVRAVEDRDIRIPASALLSGPSGEFFVWVYDPATSLVERRTVAVGTPLPAGVVVQHGLADGEYVVMAGASQLQDGMRIRPLGQPVAGQ